MLIDTRTQEKETSEKGFNPNVQNNQIPATCSGGEKCLFWILTILTFGLWGMFTWVSKSNNFNRLQVKANEASSNIDVQLKKRRDTLIKMVDATQSSFNYERSVLMDVTKLRTANNFSPTKGGGANAAKLDGIYSKLLATFENYPKLESIAAVRDMMQTADYTEREIAASRRLYNAAVNEFNECLYVWPDKIIATSKKLYNLPLFAASAEDRKDVSLKLS